MPDGRLGKLCVSRFHEILFATETENLVIHITFTIQQIFVPSQQELTRANPAAIAVDIRNLHYTARPKSTQLAVSSDRFVAAAPDSRDVSTHRGINNTGTAGKRIDAHAETSFDESGLRRACIAKGYPNPCVALRGLCLAMALVVGERAVLFGVSQ